MNIIGIEDLNQPIFRIYAKRWFLEVLHTQTNTLRNPSAWKDPFENFFLARTQVAVNGDLATLENLAQDWYGQCWTINSDTDAMWRIYSSEPHSGIQVRTTIRRLYDNLTACPSEHPELQFFVGQVEYLSQDAIVEMMSELTFGDIAWGSRGEGFARLLCIKREAFQHEAEVRILFQDHEPRRGVDGSFAYALNPNAVFEEIVFDPRLEDAQAAEVQRELQEAGCAIPARQSDLYQAPHFTIPT